MFKSDKFIREIEVTGERFELSEDIGLPIGRLYLRVSPKGAKTFYFRYWSSESASSVYMKIGKFPTVSLSKARAMAKQFAADVAGGEDPVLTKKIAKRDRSRLGSFRDLLNYYLDSLKSRSAKSVRNVSYSFEKNVIEEFPDLLEKKANEITTQDIVDIIATYIKKGATADANRLRSYLHAAFNVAATAENDPLNAANSPVYFRLASNPVSVVKRQSQFESVGERVVEPDELRAWLKHYERYSSPVMFALTKALFFAGGPRVSVLLNARFDMIDEKQMILDIPGEITKNGTPHIIPIIPELIDVFKFMAELHGSDGLIFPSYTRRVVDLNKPMSSTSLAQSFRRSFIVCPHYDGAQKRCLLKGDCFDQYYQGESFVPKDIRRTVKTWMGRAGIDKSIRDRLQHHSMTDVSSKHYDRYDYLEEKRQAMNTWREWLNSEVF